MNKKKKIRLPENASAPGIDPDDSFGKKATKTEMKKNESTTVTRLKYDEYYPSEN